MSDAKSDSLVSDADGEALIINVITTNGDTAPESHFDGVITQYAEHAMMASVWGMAIRGELAVKWDEEGQDAVFSLASPELMAKIRSRLAEVAGDRRRELP